ncbi:hypothetical protein KIL84_000818 [Mauremys mutica]|uniref:Uncharacterized protein n=1 Tax=Mauremys mutica TaxID=74926 RepID=A0A9D3WZQ1_9SAUR|nr:hypothetical protein KIL84_000818 [Mauremys mutica]
MDSANNDIPLHSNIWWLSRGKVLVHFVNCFDVIKAFLSEKAQNYPVCLSPGCRANNLCLQGAGQTVLDLYEAWKAFVVKLAVFSRNIRTSTFRYFQHIKELSTHCTVSVNEIGMYMQELESEFSDRCQDFQ